MKKSKKMRDMTLEIYGKMLMIVSRINLSDTDDLISLNILIILKALNTVAKAEKLASSFRIFSKSDRSVVKTMIISKMFQV